ncbi:MAG: FtsX-like permease family protein [Sedimentisphaerales bacterium]|nr:FtsX-like permease family protein [Sedimentisphaerales bacterium]
MLKLFLWLRYLRKRKIVFLSVAAVALSVSLLIVVASLFTGFIETFEQAAVEAVGDVVISPSPPLKIAKYPQLIEQLEQTSVVETATAMLITKGLLNLGKGNVRPVEIWGIEPGERARVTHFKECLRRQKDSPGEPSFSLPDFPERLGGFVGIGVVAEPNDKTDEYDYDAVDAAIGWRIIVTTGTIKETPQNDSTKPQFKKKTLIFWISDIFETGVYQFDQGCVYLPIEELQERLYPEEEHPVAEQIIIKLADPTKTDVSLAVIRGVWDGFVREHLGSDPYLLNYTSVETAIEMQRPWINAYMNQLAVLFVIFGVVSLCVIVLVFCIFYMIVTTKRKDIAIIKSCGMASRSVAVVFVGFGACIGVIGSGVGAVLGYVITDNINTIENWIRIIFGLKLWKSSVYMFSKIPNEVNWTWAFCIIMTAILAAAVGALIPAIVAALTKPVEILRYE